MPKKDPRRQKLLDTAEQIRSLQSGDNKNSFRMVITGKGGVGKTTFTSVLAKLLTRKDFKVLAVDEDPQINLPYSLGLPLDTEIVPASRNVDYIEEKTGARPGEVWGAMLRLNPDVSDVVDRFGIKVDDNLNLIVMGSVIQAAAGCLCPENALLDSVVKFIALREGEVILLDTQAGVEHFGRALAQGFKQTVILSEPTFNAYQVAKHSAVLSRQLDIPYVHLVVTKIRSDEQLEKFRKIAGDSLNAFNEVFTLPFDEKVMETEPDVTPLLDQDTPYIHAMKKIADTLADYGMKSREE
jgi:CO dehydrogenase maturation factor